MRADADVKRDVEDALQYDPNLNSTNIAVAVKDGVVTLAGFVPSYLDKTQAEYDAKRVDGVLGVANDIEVRIPDVDRRPDPDLVRDAVEQIGLELPFAHEAIKVLATDGWMTLEGEVEWHYQKERAETAVRRVKGIKGISNFITLRPRIEPTDIKRRIEEAFRRSAEIDAERVQVEAVGGDVVLKGTVRSWAEREEAERVAWQAPGVRNVDNRLVIQ